MLLIHRLVDSEALGALQQFRPREDSIMPILIFIAGSCGISCLVVAYVMLGGTAALFNEMTGERDVERGEGRNEADGAE